MIDLFDLLQTVVIFHEESQILEGHIHSTVTSLLFVFLYSGSTSREGIFVNLQKYIL